MKRRAIAQIKLRVDIEFYHELKQKDKIFFAWCLKRCHPTLTTPLCPCLSLFYSLPLLHLKYGSPWKLLMTEHYNRKWYTGKINCKWTSCAFKSTWLFFHGLPPYSLYPRLQAFPLLPDHALNLSILAHTVPGTCSLEGLRFSWGGSHMNK